MKTVLVAAAGFAALLVGCSGSGSSASRPSEPASAPSSLPSAATAPELKPILDPVVADAAKRLAVEAAEVSVVTMESTTWSDGALGCPKEGELYTQALVDGHHIVVTARGTSLDYRVTGPGAFRLCENPAFTEPY
ncbi:MAG: hypothetical protein H0U52_03145 [Chloroflexi bacterium]|nr:hypothetical protein [Chloroflexota bacterium]